MILSGKKLIVYKAKRVLDLIVAWATVAMAVYLLMGIAITFA